MGLIRAAAVTDVHVIVPEGIDDPTRPSGGNTYDRRVCAELAALGWAVQMQVVGDLAGALERLPDGSIVLLDGLVASPAPEVLVPEAGRLRLVALVHMPLGDRSAADETRAREGDVLAGTAAVVTTSAWTRRRLLELYALPRDRVHVAEPGVDAADLAPGTTAGDALLCVAAVTRGKGHDVLLDALATATDLPWLCACVGSVDRDPAFADRVRRRAWARGLGDRIRFTGPRTGPDLASAFAAADLLVLASRAASRSSPRTWEA